MLEVYGIQDAASRFVRLRSRLLWRLRPLSSFFLNLISAFFFLLMEACGSDSLILLQHPCSSLTFLQLHREKGFAQGAGEINH